jgi:Cu-processing system ATP-binding protein
MTMTTSHRPAIEIAGLRKRFGRSLVLDGIDASITRGRVTALVGPNAAGKSTLLKCILGLVRPDAGTLVVDGVHVGVDPGYRHAIGYMPQRAPFPENLTGHEVLRLLRQVRGDVPVDFELIDRFGVGGELSKRVATLSGGTRQKLNAIAAHLFRPSIVILDEPSAGLDPLANRALKRKILQARDAGVTHLITSHVLGEVEELADEVLMLLDGGVHYCGSLHDLRIVTGERHLEPAIGRLMEARRS